VKFVPGGIAKTFIPTKEAEQKSAYDEWLARIVCFAFSISPQALIAQVNRATAETARAMRRSLPNRAPTSRAMNAGAGRAGTVVPTARSRSQDAERRWRRPFRRRFFSKSHPSCSAGRRSFLNCHAYPADPNHLKSHLLVRPPFVLLLFVRRGRNIQPTLRSHPVQGGSGREKIQLQDRGKEAGINPRLTSHSIPTLTMARPSAHIGITKPQMEARIVGFPMGG
jgi:hypothetical protein